MDDLPYHPHHSVRHLIPHEFDADDFVDIDRPSKREDAMPKSSHDDECQVCVIQLFPISLVAPKLIFYRFLPCLEQIPAWFLSIVTLVVVLAIAAARRI